MSQLANLKALTGTNHYVRTVQPPGKAQLHAKVVKYYTSNMRLHVAFASARIATQIAHAFVLVTSHVSNPGYVVYNMYTSYWTGA